MLLLNKLSSNVFEEVEVADLNQSLTRMIDSTPLAVNCVHQCLAERRVPAGDFLYLAPSSLPSGPVRLVSWELKVVLYC